MCWVEGEGYEAEIVSERRKNAKAEDFLYNFNLGCLPVPPRL